MSVKVAAYCRVSTDTEEQLGSLESQKQYFAEYIEKAEDWDLVEVYYDEGVSGTSTRHREGFQRMMYDAEAGKIQLIITKEVSRFARNTVDTLSYTRQLRGMGVGVLFINDNINTLEPDGELRLTIMASMAQEESRKTSERVKWGQKRRMEQGVVFGRSLLGYDVQGGRMTINPEGAEIVRLIFHKYVNENKGTHVIARELLEAGIRPCRVKEWSNTVILRVLRNEKYVGDLCQKKTYTPDYLTHSRKYNRGAEEKVYLKDHHEPIIDRDLWNRAQAILAGRTLTDEQRSRHSCRYWCSGRIVCGECGERFVSRTKKLSGGNTYKAWRCEAMAKYGTKKQNIHGVEVGCMNQSVNEQVLLESVGYVLRLMQISRKELIEEMKTEIAAVLHTIPQVDAAALAADVRRMEGKKQTLLDRFLEGIVSEADYKRQNALYDEQIAEIQRKIDAHQQLQTELNHHARKTEECIECVKKMLDFETPDEHICGEVTERITVHYGHTLEVKLRYIPAVRLKYRTSGRGSRYTAEFERI
ncbi:MAG: recombinase family protein [Oscillospiraceae bacterium]|nr:recombinase family protein [Oscillospiraceae bacterium]